MGRITFDETGITDIVLILTERAKSSLDSASTALSVITVPSDFQEQIL